MAVASAYKGPLLAGEEERQLEAPAGNEEEALRATRRGCPPRVTSGRSRRPRGGSRAWRRGVSPRRRA
jgi:hypothetical protein